MLRITTQNASDVIVLKLEGSLRGPWVEELRKAWLASAAAGTEPVNVDLAAVSFLDVPGRDLLLRMRKEGVALKGGSSFVRQMLDDSGGQGEQSSRNDRSSQ